MTEQMLYTLFEAAMDDYHESHIYGSFESRCDARNYLGEVFKMAVDFQKEDNA